MANIPLQKKRFPYGSKRASVLDIRQGLQPYDAEALLDSVHGAGGSRVLGAIEAMPNATRDNARSVVHGVMDKQTPNVTYRPGETKYSPRDEMINIDPGLHQRYPVATSVHEGTHAFQSGRLNLADKISDRATFGSHDSASRELGPSLIGHLAELEARRRGGSPTPNVNYSFPSGYQPSLEWMRQQAVRFGLFEGAPNGNIDELLAKNPQWLRAIAQESSPPSGAMSPPSDEDLGGFRGDGLTQRSTPPRLYGNNLPSPSSFVRESSSQTRATSGILPGVDRGPGLVGRAARDPNIRPPTPTTAGEIVPKETPMPFDIAASARPATPVNKKKKWSNDFLSQKYADTDVESSMYRDAAQHEPEETAAFRDRRSARDRMLGGNGLNVGRTGSGERVNPMMPGVPMGAVNENYGGIGDKSRWFTDMANFKHDPNTEQRQGMLLQDGLVQRFARHAGIPVSDAREMNGGDMGGTVNTAANRISALKGMDGLAGAAKLGLQDRFVSGSSLTRGPNDTPERTLQLDKIAAVRQGEKQRKLDLRGNVNDPTSIAGRIATRGVQKAFDRQQRMAGPTDEQRVMAMASQGNPQALAMLGMMQQNKRSQGDQSTQRYIADKQYAGTDPQQRTDAMTSAYYAPGPNGEPSPSDRGITRQEFGLPEIGGRSNGQSPPPLTSTSMTSGIDRTMGTGFSEQLTDALSSTSPNMFGGYLQPSAPLFKLKPLLDKLDAAGLSNDPQVIETIKRNIPPEFLKHLKGMAAMPRHPGVTEGSTSFLQDITGQSQDIQPQAQRLLKLLGM